MWRLSKSSRIEQLVVFKFRGERHVPAGLLTFEGAGTRRIGRFVYARSYLEAGAAPIDPIGLPARRGSRSAQPEEVQLAFHDSGPDGWGKSILDLAFPDLTLSMPEYLALGGLRRTGDLAYGPSPEAPQTWQPATAPLIKLPDDDDDVEALARAAEAVEQGERTTNHLQLLARASSGLGGARPKARLRHRGGDWIAKFAAWGDTFDDPKLEAVCLDACAAAGIETPRHELLTLGRRSVLLVERFDRDEGGRPFGYLSAGTLLGEPSMDYGTAKTYADIVDVGRRIGAPDPAKDVFKRLVMNASLRNIDDHSRNHAFIDEGAGWRLSPVFDVVPNLKVDRHVMAPAPGISPRWRGAAVRDTYARFGLKRAQADEIVEAVEGAVRRLPEFMEAREVTRRDRHLVLGAIGIAPPKAGRTGEAAIERRSEFVRTLEASTPSSQSAEGRVGLCVQRKDLVAALSAGGSEEAAIAALRLLTRAVSQPEYRGTPWRATGAIIRGRDGMEHLASLMSEAENGFARLFLDAAQADECVRSSAESLGKFDALARAHKALAGRGDPGPRSSPSRGGPSL